MKEHDDVIMNSTWGADNNETELLCLSRGGGHCGYNWPVLFLFLIVVAAIGGNVLVCLAVRQERKLQSMFNFFLVSLALSDMLSATLVMPLSIVKSLIADQLPVPKLMCVAWYSLDVLLTSSTIIHLCMISIDRYMSLKFPLRYGHAKRSCKQTLFKILLVWVISFCIAGPLFLFSMLDTTQSAVAYKGCGPETPAFVVSATVTSFYLPLLIMTIMYALTMRALRCQLHEQRRLAVTKSLSSRDDSTYSLRRASPRASPRLPHKSNNNSSSNGFFSGRSPLPLRKTDSSCMQPPQPPTPAAAEASSDFLVVRGAYTAAPMREMTPSSTCTEVDIALQDFEVPGGDDVTGKPPQAQQKQRRYIMRQFRFGRDGSNSARRSIHGPDRGRRAVQVLGILFAVFVICYLPFFLTYVIKGTCRRCEPYISPRMIMAFEWLAYSGSVINPIIYHIFNPDFRRAFTRLLCCRCPR